MEEKNEEPDEKDVRESSVESEETSSKEEDLLSIGNSLFEEGKFKEAIEIYTDIIEKLGKECSPQTLLALLKNRGLSYYVLGKIRVAKKDFKKMIELNPKDSESFKNRAFCYLGLKKYKKCITDLTRAIEIDPDDFEAYRSRGLAYFNCQDYEKSLDNFSKAIELNPEVYVEAFNNRGVTYRMLGRLDLALLDFTKAINSKPNFTNSLENRGIVLKKIGRFEESFFDLLLSNRIKKFEEKSRFRFKQSLFHSLESSLSNWEKSKTKNPHFLNVFQKISDGWRKIIYDDCDIIVSGKRGSPNRLHHLYDISVKSVFQISKKEMLDLRNTKRKEFLDLAVATIHESLLNGVYTLEETKKELSRSLQFFSDHLFDRKLFQVVVCKNEKNYEYAYVIKIISGFSPLTLQPEGKGVEFVDPYGKRKKKRSAKRIILGMTKLQDSTVLRKMYVGDFKNGKREGIGNLYSPSLSISGSSSSFPSSNMTGSNLYSRIKFHGEFKNGLKNGKGIEYQFLPKYDQFQPIHIFEGLFRNNMRNGRGEEFDPKSGKVRRGYWEDGKFEEKSSSVAHHLLPSSQQQHINNIVYDCPIISYNMIEKHLQSLHIVGSGAFGVIYKLKTSYISSLRNIQNRKYVAVKIMKVNSLKELMILFQITRRGIGLCQTFTSPHVLEIYAIIRGSREVGYVTGLCDKSVDKIIREEKSRKEFESFGSSSSENIDSNKVHSKKSPTESPSSSSSTPTKNKNDTSSLDIAEKIRILYETSLGMKALHENLIMHRDLKWSNVLKDFDGVIKITDFDTLKEDEIQWRLKSRVVLQSSRIGTPGFLAPEVFKGRKYTLKCDVYAFGLMIYSLLWEQNLPFVNLYQCDCGNSMNSILRSNSLDYHVANCDLRPSITKEEINDFPPFLISLMRQCWDKNPFNRPSFDDIVNRFEMYQQLFLSSSTTLHHQRQEENEQDGYALVKFRFPKYERFLKDQDMVLTKPFQYSKVREWIEKKFDTLGLKSKVVEEEEEETEGEECEDKEMIRISSIICPKNGQLIKCDEDFIKIIGSMKKDDDGVSNRTITLDIIIEENEILDRKLSFTSSRQADILENENVIKAEQKHEKRQQKENSYFYEEYQKIKMENEKMKRGKEEMKKRYEEEIIKLNNVIKKLMKSITEKEVKKDDQFELSEL